MEGTLVDRYDQAASADIVWEDLETGSAVGKASTDPVTGRYFIVLPTGKIYGYFVVADGYFGTSSSLDLRTQSKFEVVQEDIELVYIEDALDAEKDLTIRINNLFFEFGSDKLTPGRELVRPELKKQVVDPDGQVLLRVQRVFNVHQFDVFLDHFKF